MGAFAGPESNEDGLVLALDAANTKSSIPVGQQTYTSAGTYYWTCPEGVKSVSAVCVGGGGAGGARGTHVTNGSSAQGGYGGGLGWKNNISVTPGQTYIVVVGAGGQAPSNNNSNDQGGDGGDSYFINATTVKGGGGPGGLPGSDSSVVFQMAGAGYVGDGGGYGGRGGVGQDFTGSPGNPSGGGGGAGGYSGNGGDGGSAEYPSTYTSGNAGSGGAGGGGSSAAPSGSGHRIGSGGGGGVGLLGEGTSGGVTSIPNGSGSGTYGGKGGSGGADAADNPWNTGDSFLPGSVGGLYGGGGGGQSMAQSARNGAGGGVRIMWGPGRSYPSTNTTDQSLSTWTDTSGKGNNGTISGATHTSGVGGYLDFDGSNDVILVDNSIRTTVGEFVATNSNPFSISVWFKPDTSNTNRNCIFSKANGFGQTGNIYLEYSGTNLTAVIRGLGNPDFYTSLSNNTWHEVTLCWDGTTFKSYVNGSFVSNLNKGTASSQNVQVKIGNSGNSNEPFAGQISNVKVYTKALTASEVKQNYNTLKGKYVNRFKLYDFTSAFFTVSRALTDDPSASSHRFGPTQTEVRSWLSGSSNGGGSHSWANTYVDCPVKGYQRWTVPKDGKYRITAKGGGSGYTDTPDDYMLGVKVTADFNLTLGEKLILAVGQGVPDYDGDHCNGGGGASWVMRGSKYTTAIPLIVANGAGGDTSDGNNAKVQSNVTLGNSITVTPTSGEDGGSAVTGKQTYANLPGSTAGRGSQNTSRPNSGGWLSDGADAGETDVGGHGFRHNLIGGNRSNPTAGYGGFGGGSGGEDESGSAGGGFTGAYGEDGTGNTGHGSSFVNDDNEGNVSVALAQATTTFQNTDYTSEDQYQGWIKIEFIS